MSLSLGEKAQRVLRLLMGLRNPRVSLALAAYGFSETDLNEGWTLLQALGRGKLSTIPFESTNLTLIERIDAWENQWFPIAIASLSRRYPAVHARLFANLSQTEGPEVAVSVRTFVERYDALTATNSPYGAEGPKAKELLQMRGLTPAVVEQARSLLDALTKVAPSTLPVSPADAKAELSRTEDALWAWYLEWSQVARTAIQDRPLLRQLGFLNERPSAAAEEEPPPAPGPNGKPALAP